MKSPYEKQPTREELLKGWAAYSKAIAALARQADGDARIQLALERRAKPWLIRLLLSLSRVIDRIDNDVIAGLCSLAFIGFSFAAAIWHAAWLGAAVYFGILFCMIRVNQIRSNAPVYISPMEDEEENGEVAK